MPISPEWLRSNRCQPRLVVVGVAFLDPGQCGKAFLGFVERGFQGGSLYEVTKYGKNNDCGLLVNASRAIIYAGEKENFADEARIIAQQYQNEMAGYL